MSIIKYVTLQKIVAHDFRYDPRTTYYFSIATVVTRKHMYVALLVDTLDHSLRE